MKNLIIIGSGDFGREVYDWALQSEACGRDWQLKGYLDDNPNDDFPLPMPVLGAIRDYESEEDDVFVCAIGKPEIRATLCRELVGRGWQFTNVIHRTVVMGSRNMLGCGIILCPRVTLSCDIKMGDHVIVNMHSTISHGARLGDFVQLSNQCDLTGNVCLEEGAWLGSHASIFPNVRVGAWAKVGANTSVTKHVKAGQTVYGVPARVISAERGALSG